jgi:hypothetical protein
MFCSKQVMIGTSQNIWGFDPRTIPNCALWLDPADTSTVTLNGNNVSQLTDKSGLGYNMSQTTAGNQPTYATALNGNRMLTFTQASSTHLSNTSFPALIGAGAASYFLVEYNMTSASGNPGPFGYSAGPNFGIIMQSNAGFTGGLQPFQSGITSFTSATPRLTFLYKVNVGSSNMIGFVNGTSQTVSDTTSGTYSGTFSVGSGPNGFISGNICELIVFNNRALTSSERQQVEGYLADKWGLQTSIPSTHPYRSLRPNLQYFQPTGIADCQLWFDGGDYRTMFQNTTGTTPVTDAGQSVARWNDKVRGLAVSNTGVLGQSVIAPTSVSGGGIFFSNTSSVVGPNGRGLGTSLTGASNQSNFLFRMPNKNMTMVIASYPMCNDNLRQPFCLGSHPIGTTLPNFSMGLEIGAGNGGSMLFNYNGSAWGQVATSSSGYNSNTVLRIDVLTADTTPLWSTNGTSNTFTTTNNYTNATSNYPVNHVTMGAYSSTIVGSRNYHGNIYEILFYSRVLSLAERQQLEGYLAWKWGLTSSLPAAHAYKTIPTALTVPPVVDPLTNSGLGDGFVVKYDSTGIPLWARRMGGTGTDESRSVSVDSSGNVIVAGYYNSSPLNIFAADGTNVSFTLARSVTPYEAFVVKYDSSGTPIWARRLGGSGDELAYSVSTDSSQNIIVVGSYSSNPLNIFAANGTTVSLTLTGGGGNCFVVKYDSSGTPLWARRIGGTTGGNELFSVSTDSSGNIVVAGRYSSNPINIYAANGTTVSFTLANAGSQDAFLVKYDSSGTPLWARRLSGANGNETVNSVTTDSSGNVVVAGEYSSNPLNIFAANGSTISFTLVNSGGVDAFVVKYNSSGTPLWARRMGGAGNDYAYSVSTDSSQNIIVVGSYSSNPLNIFAANGTTVSLTLPNTGAGGEAFVVKYDSSGTPIWARRLGGSGDELAYSVSTDSSGNVVVAGEYSSNPLNIFAANGTTVSFTLANSGSSDAFVVKYDSSGTPLWARRIVGTSSGVEQGRSVSTDSSGNIIVAGLYSSTSLRFYG